MELTRPITAVLLAGGPRDDVCAGTPGAPNKAFVPIGGITLARRALAALRSSPRVGDVIAVAPPGEPAASELAEATSIRPDGASMSQSLRNGLAGLPAGELVLVAASDLPILSRAAIEEFLELAERSGADVVYACLERNVHEARFPDVPHTWARLQDGTYCGGGLVALRPRALEPLDRFLGKLGAARKNPLRLATIFGYDVLVRYALRRLRIADAERRATALLGVPAAAAISSYPEIAVNVDRPSDVALAERLVSAIDETRSISRPNGEGATRMTLSILLTTAWDTQDGDTPPRLDVPKVRPHRFAWKNAGTIGIPKDAWKVVPQRWNETDVALTTEDAEIITSANDESLFRLLHGVIAKDANYDELAARLRGYDDEGVVDVLRGMAAQHPDAMWFVRSWTVEAGASE